MVNIAVVPGARVKNIVVGDFNGDGKLDLATSNFNFFDQTAAEGVAVLLGNGDGTFKAPSILPALPNTQWIQAADVNGDGKLDLVSVYTPAQPQNTPDSKIQVWLGKGDGTFALKGAYPLGIAASGEFTLADMNGDRKIDVVVTGISNVSTTPYKTQLVVLEGNGDGSFSPAQYTPLPASAISLLVADWNNDGRLDVMGNVIGGYSWFFEQKPLVWLSTLHMAFGDQAVGSFSPTQTLTVTNTGSVAVSITGVGISGPGAAEFTQTHDCTSTLAARGGACTVTVQFAPASAGSFSATLTINHEVEGTKTVALSGTGI
jgi:hypothetical protein